MRLRVSMKEMVGKLRAHSPVSYPVEPRTRGHIVSDEVFENIVSGMRVYDAIHCGGRYAYARRTDFGVIAHPTNEELYFVQVILQQGNVIDLWSVDLRDGKQAIEFIQRTIKT